MPRPTSHDFILLGNPRITSRALPPQLTKPIPEVVELARPGQAQCNDEDCKGKRGGPVHPLAEGHVPHVRGVHAHDAGNGTKGEEDDCYNGEGIDGCFLTIFVGVDLLDVLELTLAHHNHDTEVEQYTQSPSSEAISRISLNPLMRFSTSARLSWMMRL